MPVAAVITADIVNSTQLTRPVEKKLTSLLGTLLEKQKFEFYRGDSFQVYIKDPAAAFAIAVEARAIARSFSSRHDIRASIGIGKVNTPVKALRTATGEAFILSGRTFDQLNNEQRLAIQSSHEQANSTLRVIAWYTDYLFKNLTPKQAAVVAGLLKDQTQTVVAKKLKKTQATINKHVQAAGWYEMEKLLKEYNQVITQFKLL